jgi:hypothetical protein
VIPPVLSHHPFLFDAFLILLTPSVLGVILWRFCPDEPRNGTGQDLQDLTEDEPEPASADLTLVA